MRNFREVQQPNASKRSDMKIGLRSERNLAGTVSRLQNQQRSRTVH